MTFPHDPFSRRRRLIMPLVVLAVAGGIAFWASQRDVNRMEQVRHLVLSLCRHAAEGRDVPELNATAPALRAPLLAQLKNICPSRDYAATVDVIVTPGDVKSGGGGGSLVGTATHTAIIVAGGTELLGLRIQHTGDPHDIRILGYWVPQPVNQ